MNRLGEIQKNIKIPKGQYNSFGKYYFRSCEDILSGLKLILTDNESVVLSDDVVSVGDRIYIKATVKIISEGLSIGSATAFAREALNQKGMNDAQITGSSSSYARKYALNGLLALDDIKDDDTKEPPNNSHPETKIDDPRPPLTPDMKEVWSRAVKALTENKPLSLITESYILSPANEKKLKADAEKESTDA